MNVETYLELHFEPAYKNWEALERKLFLSPAKHKINISEIDFTNPGKNASEIMWFYSLGWLAKYSSCDDVDLDVLEYLEAFHNGLENGTLSNVHKISSLDHCAASRIRYLCMIYARFPENNSINNIIKKILRFELAWFNTLSGVAYNNHGMMLCVSVFHAALIVGRDDLTDELNTALKWLKGVLDSVIPLNGYVVENTIGYHDFYYKYIKSQIVFFDEYYHDLEIYDYLDDLFNRVELALYKVVTPNGNIPPLGQCGFYPTRYKSIPGTHLFKEQGFLVVKDDLDYFSYICGYASPVHKQLDNTSFSLSLSGCEIFIDSGLGTYNEKDPRSSVINGQRGHTGAFFRALDNEHRHLFLISKELKNVNSSINMAGDIISSKFSLDFNEHKYFVSRDIIFKDFRTFSIIDRFVTNNQYGFPVSRFILPHKALISIEGNIISIDYPNHQAKMKIDSTFNYSFKVGSDEFEEVEFAAGWRSVTFGGFEKCKIIEIYPTSDELRINISISNKK